MAKAREINGLNCDASASEGMRLVIRTRLEELSDLQADSSDWPGLEAVHDMRVASRRLRSVLRDFKPYLRREGLPQKHLKAVADRLGYVRDLDVLIAALEKLREDAPEEVAQGIDHLLDQHKQRRERAQAKLEDESFDTLLAELHEQFDIWLARAVKGPQRIKKGLYRPQEKSFAQIGSEVILARYRDLLEMGQSLYTPFDVEEIHNLRIAAKRLRYALELFAACRGEQLAPFAEETAELQKSLGELHDRDVWMEATGERLLKRSGKGADESGPDSGEAERRARVWLLRHFAKERTKHYRDALARWHEWETTRFFAGLIAVLEPAPRAEVAAQDDELTQSEHDEQFPLHEEREEKSTLQEAPDKDALMQAAQEDDDAEISSENDDEQISSQEEPEDVLLLLEEDEDEAPTQSLHATPDVSDVAVSDNELSGDSSDAGFQDGSSEFADSGSESDLETSAPSGQESGEPSRSEAS